MKTIDFDPAGQIQCLVSSAGLFFSEIA